MGFQKDGVFCRPRNANSAQPPQSVGWYKKEDGKVLTAELWSPVSINALLLVGSGGTGVAGSGELFGVWEGGGEAEENLHKKTLRFQKTGIKISSPRF